MQNRIHLYSWQETGEEDVDNSDVGELTISSHYRHCAAAAAEGEGRRGLPRNSLDNGE